MKFCSEEVELSCHFLNDIITKSFLDEFHSQSGAVLCAKVEELPFVFVGLAVKEALEWLTHEHLRIDRAIKTSAYDQGRRVHEHHNGSSGSRNNTV